MKVFISYSWDDEAHKKWVHDLASRLRDDGVETILDQWHLAPGDQLPQFMETSVRESEFVLIVCTPRYRARSDSRAGGVGYEGDIMTGEVLTTRNQRKFIPILARGPWAMSAPAWLAGKYYLNFTNTPPDNGPYDDLVTTLFGTKPAPPPIRSRPSEASQPPAVPTTESGAPEGELRITGVLVDQVGTPRNDGSRGSALYEVPFKLSRQPPLGWDDCFIRAWNYPSSFTTMHRPGIASVVGDRIILDGTTVEEVERYHRTTLVQAVKKANEDYAESKRRREEAAERERRRVEEHRSAVAEAAKKIRFD